MYVGTLRTAAASFRFEILGEKKLCVETQICIY